MRNREIIYLHFLNRELYRDAGMSKQNVDTLISNVLKNTYIFTYEPLETSIAFIWELYYDSPKSRKIILELLQYQLIHLISSFYSVDEMIAFNQKIYRNEPIRYKMYFDNIPHKLQQHQPEILKTENTTNRIESDLRRWISTGQSSLLDQPQDIQLLNQNHTSIERSLDTRNNRAITLSLFNNDEFSVFNLKQLGRNISLIHINTYMEHIGADIVTGIGRLHFYDRLSRCFPLNDYYINSKIIEICDIRAIDNYENLLKQEIKYGKAEKIAFIENVRHLVLAIYSSPSCQGETMQQCRARICNRLLKYNAAMPPLEKEISWAYLNKRVQLLNRLIERDDSVYLLNRIIGEQSMKSLLLCTATDKETDALFQKAKSFNLIVGTDSVRKIEDNYIYELGSIGNLNIFVAQTEMGTERMGSARDKIRDLTRTLTPDYVISTGICYGLKPKHLGGDNEIGDIIVANQIQMYETAKVYESDGEEKVIPRGDRAAVSTELLDALRTASHFYEKHNVSFGLLLSGNLLVNSRALVKKMKDGFPDALNGDMEAGGIYSACHDSSSRWIAIKSISDWGYDKTDEHQDLARENLYDFIFYVLNTKMIK